MLNLCLVGERGPSRRGTVKPSARPVSISWRALRVRLRWFWLRGTARSSLPVTVEWAVAFTGDGDAAPQCGVLCTIQELQRPTHDEGVFERHASTPKVRAQGISLGRKFNASVDGRFLQFNCFALRACGFLDRSSELAPTALEP